MVKKLKLLSLFSGIGGLELGLERSGAFETAAQCEINEFCRRVLAKHWPDVRRYEDVRTLSAELLRCNGIAIDAICGGFPCQDVSIAGTRTGLSGERSGLWHEMRRLVGDIRPCFVIVENTPGLLSLGMGTVLGDLAALGYDAVWHGIPASAAGAAHPRDRVWIIAYNSRERRIELANDNREHAVEVLQNINRKLALSLRKVRKQQPHADPLACFGARIPDGGEARASYIRSALRGKSDGLPGDMDAIGALGNAVVPQIPELIGRAILQSMEEAA